MPFVPVAATLAIAATALPLHAQGITAGAQIVATLESTTFDSCTQSTSQQLLPPGPLPSPVSMPGFTWDLGAAGIAMTAGGAATICSFSSPPGSFSRNGTVDVTLTAPFETTCRIRAVGTYSGSGGVATTTISGPLSATLGGFFQPVTNVDRSVVVRVGPAPTTVTITHACSVTAGLFGFASVQTSLDVTWTVVDAAATESYGTGCGAGGPTLAPSASPRLGSTMSTVVSAVPGPIPVGVVAIGLSDLHSGLGPLPAPLDPVGMTGCWLLQSGDFVGAAQALSPTSLSFQLALPAGLQLVGINLFTQAFVLAPGANPLGVIASNGVRWQLGT